MIECVVCKSPTSEKKYNSRNENLLTLNRCSKCGHLFQDIENYEDIYSDGKFTKIARESEIVPGDKKIKNLDDIAFKRFNFYKPLLKKESKALEIGSSIGSFVHLLKLYGIQANGIEPDPHYCDHSVKQYGFAQVNSSLERYESDQKYDQIFSFHVVEHVKDPILFIEKICSLLTHNGILFLECPSQEISEYGNKQQMIWEPHIHYFSSTSIYQLLSTSFSKVKISYRGGGLSVIAEKPIKSNLKKTQLLFEKIKQSFISGLVFLTPQFKSYEKINSLRRLIIQFLIERKLFKFRMKRSVKFGLYKIKEHNYLKKENGTGKQRITHITNFKGWGNNAGDIVLSNCVRNTIKSEVSSNFNIQSVANEVNEKLIRDINESDALLVGGGGLFLPDTNKNSISGWQWAISKSQIDQIDSKVLLYAIGYNYFPGQSPNELFVDSLNCIIKKADFVGIRNKGSINAIKDLLTDKSLSDKISYQPCPTTVIRKNFSNIKAKKKTKNIAVNIAFDRYERRFGDGIYDKLYSIAIALKTIENYSYNIYNVCHLTVDEKAEIVFDRVGLKYTTVRLQHMLPNEIFDFYSKMEVVFGMRGHAQMIPFGVNTKIITLGTHRKMKWFLEDIDMMELFIDVSESENVYNDIIEKFEYIMNNDEQVSNQLISEQEKLYAVTKDNLEKISNIIKA